MSTTTHTTFDVAAFRRALEDLDGQAVAALVTDDFERTEIDQADAADRTGRRPRP